MPRRDTDDAGTTPEGIDWFKATDGRKVYIGRCCPTYHTTTVEDALLGICPGHRIYGVIHHGA